jgi:hypothetical protein
MMQAELINYLPTEQTVYLQVDMEYVKGRVGGDVFGSGLAAPGEFLALWHLCLMFESMHYDNWLASREKLQRKSSRRWIQSREGRLHHLSP